MATNMKNGIVVSPTTMKGMRSMLKGSVNPVVAFNEDTEVMLLEAYRTQQVAILNVVDLLNKLMGVIEE